MFLGLNTAGDQGVGLGFRVSGFRSCSFRLLGLRVYRLQGAVRTETMSTLLGLGIAGAATKRFMIKHCLQQPPGQGSLRFIDGARNERQRLQLS